MKNNTTPTAVCRWRRATAIAAAALCAACTAPAAHDEPVTNDGTHVAPSRANSGVPPQAQQVCAQFAETALAVDTNTDLGPAAARVRAAQQYGDAELVTTLRAEGRDTTWAELAAHRARVQVSIEPVADDPPPPHEGEAGAAVLAHRVAIGQDRSWNLEPVVLYCSLRLHGAQWRVSGLTLADTHTIDAVP